MLGYEHETTEQRLCACVALEAVVCGMPVLILVGDLALIDADCLSACRAVLNVHLFETLAAVGLGSLHEITLTTKKLVAVEASEVGHVPAAALGLGALVAENDLVAGGTARLVQLGVVATTVDLGVDAVVEVDEVYEELIAGGAVEAGRVPARLRTGAGRKDSDRAVFDHFVALKFLKLENILLDLTMFTWLSYLFDNMRYLFIYRLFLNDY